MQNPFVAIANALSSREDQEQEQFREAIFNNPVRALNSAPIERAREALQGAGYQVAATYGTTPDGGRQLRIELARSELVALRVPSVVYNGQSPAANGVVWRGLVQSGVMSAPAVASPCGGFVTVLFDQPAGVVEVRCFDFVSDAAGDRIRQAAEQTNLVEVPHEGSHGEWRINPLEGNRPEWPAELSTPEHMQEGAGPIAAQLTRWLEDNFQPDPRGGMSRDEVYAALLAATGMLPSDLERNVLSAGFSASRFTSKRTKHGYVWQIQRKPDLATLGGLPAVDSTSLPAWELAEFRAWKASMELDPARRQERRVAHEQRKAAAERARLVVQHYGSEETLERLAALRAEWATFEARRKAATGQYGEAFVPLRLGWSPLALASAPVGAYDPNPGAKCSSAEWFSGDFPWDAPPQAQYKYLVQTVLGA